MECTLDEHTDGSSLVVNRPLCITTSIDAMTSLQAMICSVGLESHEDVWEWAVQWEFDGDKPLATISDRMPCLCLRGLGRGPRQAALAEVHVCSGGRLAEVPRRIGCFDLICCKMLGNKFLSMHVCYLLCV